MTEKQKNIFILHHKSEKRDTYYQDLSSVQRVGLIHKGKHIELDTLRKIIKKDGIFNNAKYTVRKSFISIIKIKNK